ncbi:MAG: hypothetical protein BROFUL_01317 [Candidatus Brocadia fulgida]|uniref:PemK-like protein n=1 Tax=Candidatus Brocadia fulgida TaxID=380242 RepID=A0A0M2UZP7_9BACT|nr:MAG: hypothetical protein BROFUL_01317 [Candidatus Brocadia fulgida]
MITKGQIVLFKFPQTDQKEGKLRPALILRELPGKLAFGDLLNVERRGSSLYNRNFEIPVQQASREAGP